MEFETLTTQDPRYPRKLRERLGSDAPTLCFHGPLKLLDRFTMAVIAGDQIPAQAMLATTEPLLTIQQYAMNYIGPWHSVMETEMFRLAIRTRTDPERRRSLTICTARGLARETWDNFLGDRFGYKGPFTGFIEKDEFYRRAREEEILWLSLTPPEQKRLEKRLIRLRNWVACALADVVFVPFSEKGAKSFDAVKRVVAAGIPAFTCQYSADKATDVNKDLFALGIPAHTRKTVGKFLESLGAGTSAAPPFGPREPAVVQVAEDKPIYSSTPKQLDLLPISRSKTRGRGGSSQGRRFST